MRLGMDCLCVPALAARKAVLAAAAALAVVTEADAALVNAAIESVPALTETRAGYVAQRNRILATISGELGGGLATLF